MPLHQKPTTSSSTNDINLRYSNGKLVANKSEIACELGQICGPKNVFYELEQDKFYLVAIHHSDEVRDFLDEHQFVEGSKFNIFHIWDHNDFHYEPFHKDFGPFNLAITHLFLTWMKVYFETASYRTDNVVVVICSASEPEERSNITYMAAIASLVWFKRSVEEISASLDRYIYYDSLIPSIKPTVSCELESFIDVSGASSTFHMTLDHCLEAWKRALDLNFYNYYEFDHLEYVFCERVQCGDLNWIVPNKIMAFCGPSSENTVTETTHRHRPEFYYNYFKDYNVTTIIRLNRKEYDASSFTKMGFEHFDLIFPDGTAPSYRIWKKFIEIVNNAKGAVAVHCAAGLGRTGSLIGAYLITNYGFTAEAAIAWLRICRPGSVIANQQDWLVYFDKIMKDITKKKRENTKIENTHLEKDLDDKIESNTEVADDKISVFSVTSAKHGQAQGLIEAKCQRLKQDTKDSKSHKFTPPRKLPVPRTLRSNIESRIKCKEVLDLGKTIPIVMKFRDYYGCKEPDDIETYELSEAPTYELNQEPKKYNWHTWKIKYPKNTYFKLCLTEKNLQKISKMDLSRLDFCSVPKIDFFIFSKVKAFSDTYEACPTNNRDAIEEWHPPMAGQGGIVEFVLKEYILL